MEISLEVDLENLRLKQKAAKTKKNLRGTFRDIGLFLEGAMKKVTSSTKMIAPTGAYMGSITARFSKTSHQLMMIVGPTKIYSGWLEEGKNSPHSPAKLRQSSFAGYHIIERTATLFRGRVKSMIRDAIRRSL